MDEIVEFKPFRQPTMKQIELANKVKNILSRHGYPIAANSLDWYRMSIRQLDEIIRSWDIYDQTKAQYEFTTNHHGKIILTMMS